MHPTVGGGRDHREPAAADQTNLQHEDGAIDEAHCDTDQVNLRHPCKWQKVKHIYDSNI